MDIIKKENLWKSEVLSCNYQTIIPVEVVLCLVNKGKIFLKANGSMV